MKYIKLFSIIGIERDGESLIALSRLHWHCHFIQKFDNEHRMEWEPINRGYLNFPYRDINSIEQKNIGAWNEEKQVIH